MSLTSSLQIGRSALTASQLAIQVAGDNIANAATPGYTRRAVSLAPVRGQADARGVQAGRGVEVQAVRRQIDVALESRLRDALGQQAGSADARDVLSQIESLVSDLGGDGLSAQLSEFFNGFSELANNPAASEMRSVIVEQGATLARFVRAMRSDLVAVRDQVDSQVRTLTERADGLLGEIASMNRSIARSEQGIREDAALRDRRDSLVGELATLLDISTHEQPSGAVDVYVGSTPLVIGGESRGLESRVRTVDGETRLEVLVSANQEKLEPLSGRIGALLRARSGDVATTIERLDEVASNLVFEVNRLHSAGRSFPGLTDTTGWQRVPAADQARAFNDPANETLAGLPFGPRNGDITVVVVDKATGLVQRQTIHIDLDGVDSTGAAGFGDDTTLADVVAALDAVPNLNASLTTDGRLRLTTDAGFEVGFEADTSGVLATLGINTFFEGSTAQDIAIRSELAANPRLVVAGVLEGSNEVARAIAGLRDAPIESLNGKSLDEGWRRATEAVSVASAAAQTRADAASQVRQSLEAQRAAVSGVSIDEESINLLNYQRQYQAAARFISTVDELTQLLLQLV